MTVTLHMLFPVVNFLKYVVTVTEVVLFSIVAFMTLTFHIHTCGVVPVVGSLATVLLQIFS